jgi:hypothetical protein
VVGCLKMLINEVAVKQGTMPALIFIVYHYITHGKIVRDVCLCLQEGHGLVAQNDLQSPYNSVPLRGVS